MTTTTITRYDDEDTYPTRAKFGVQAWIETEVDGRNVTHRALVQMAGEAPEYINCAFDAAGRVQLVAALHEAASRRVELAAAQHEDFAALPDATPTDAEAEVAQRELIEQERQAGVAETRPASMPTLLACYGACDDCGEFQSLTEGQDRYGRESWLCPGCAHAARNQAAPAAPVAAKQPLVVVAPAQVRESGKAGNHESRYVPSDPPAVRPAPAHASAHQIPWRRSGRGGVPEVRTIDARWPVTAFVAEQDSQAEILARITPPDPEPTTTNPQADTDGDELAEALANETHFAGMVLSDCTPHEAAQHERLANAWRARVDMLRMFGADSALQDLAAHVAAPGWCERELSPTGLVISEWSLRADERLPFQELPAPRRKGTALRGKPGHDGCALCAAIDAAA